MIRALLVGSLALHGLALLVDFDPSQAVVSAPAPKLEHSYDGSRMKRIHLVICVTLALVAVMSFQSLSAQSSSDTVATITKLENDSVKADLASDTAFADKVLADDWMACDSKGNWYTKPDALKMIADTKNNNVKSEKLTDLKVRVYGNTAVATYKDTYDAMVKGQHRVQSDAVTDVWVKVGSDWKLVSSQGTATK